MQRYPSTLMAIFLVLTLASCTETPSATVSDAAKHRPQQPVRQVASGTATRPPDASLMESYIRSYIDIISPVPPQMGSVFTVTEFQWANANLAIVRYTDGQSNLLGRVKVKTKNGKVLIDSFTTEQF